jgi:UDP:flavonoid glycosyltransferase YjiC (YdhE family)
LLTWLMLTGVLHWLTEQQTLSAPEQLDPRAAAAAAGGAAVPDPNSMKSPQPSAPSHFLLTENVPHWELFPMIDLAVHHGGMGTTHAALAAGTMCIS